MRAMNRVKFIRIFVCKLNVNTTTCQVEKCKSLLQYTYYSYSLYVVFYLCFSHLVRLFNCTLFMHIYDEILGHPVEHLVEALRYKPEGREFDSRWCHWNFSLT